MNWEKEWDQSLRVTARERLNDGSFWDDRASRTVGSVFPDAMTGDQLRIMDVRVEDRILEIGPGVGRLTLPLARSSRELLVVDPSSEMLKVLETRLCSEGLSNVRSMNIRWEDVDISDLGRFDKLVSSFSLFMNDLRAQLFRMSAVAKEVYLFVPADLRMPREVQELVFGRTVVELPDHQIISSLVRDMGFEVTMSILQYPVIGNKDREAAVKHYSDMYGFSEDERVINYINNNIINLDGKFTMNTSRSVGVIWWKTG